MGRVSPPHTARTASSTALPFARAFVTSPPVDPPSASSWAVPLRTSPSRVERMRPEAVTRIASSQIGHADDVTASGTLAAVIRRGPLAYKTAQVIAALIVPHPYRAPTVMETGNATTAADAPSQVTDERGCNAGAVTRNTDDALSRKQSRVTERLPTTSVGHRLRATESVTGARESDTGVAATRFPSGALNMIA